VVYGLSYVQRFIDRSTNVSNIVGSPTTEFRSGMSHVGRISFIPRVTYPYFRPPEKGVLPAVGFLDSCGNTAEDAGAIRTYESRLAISSTPGGWTML
jgi:hypothetical protein